MDVLGLKKQRLEIIEALLRELEDERRAWKVAAWSLRFEWSCLKARMR